MLVAKVRDVITSSVKVSDQEAREWYNWQNASVDIDFAVFEPNSYQNIQPTAEETNKFFEAHQASYKTEPMIKVRYLLFSPDAYRSKVTVAENDIQNYYETYQAEFKKPKTIEARHILIKVDPSADPETVAKQRQKALEILKMAQEGQDFAKLAQQYSQGPTRSRGGYLGEFRKESMVKPFADRAFSMAAGEISQPVRTRFGWHIIKVEKVNPATALSFEEARDTILKKLTDEAAKNLAYDAAEAVSEVSFEGDDLVQAALERNLKLMTTSFITQSRPDIKVGSPARFASVAFDLPAMEISDIQNFKEGYYIMQVIEKIPAKISAFETVKDRVRDDLIEEIQDQKAHQDADAFFTALKNGQSMASASKKYNLTPQTSGFFKRDVSSSKIGLDREIVKTAFTLSEENKLPTEVLKGAKGYYVIRFKARKAPDPLGFNTKAAKIKQSLLAQKTDKTFNAYLERIKSNSEITIKEGFLE
jgi:peptidyl-prolyl cis-trans isomerase D